MRFLYFVVDMFINTFGITQPTPAARRHAAFFILGLMICMIAGVAAVGTIVHTVMK